MKANPVRLKLVQTVILEHFGCIVHSIAKALLSHGRCSIGQLIQYSKQSLSNVKSSLFILLQHGLVSFVETVEGSRSVVYYEAKVDQMLKRNHLPIYMATISYLYGSEASVVFNQFCKHGRLNWSQLENVVGADKKPCFIQLIQMQFLSKYSTEEAWTEMDQLLRKEAEAIERKGSILTPNELSKLKKEVALKIQYDQDSKAGMKRKWAAELEGKLDEDAFVRRFHRFSNSFQKDKDYYCINFDRFDRYYRDYESLLLAEKKINSSAALLLEAMFKVNFQDGNESEMSIMKLSSFLDPEISFSVEGPCDSNKVAEYMEALVQNDVPFILKCDDKGSGLYKVNRKEIIQRLQVRIIESMLQEDFGVLGCRIWRILLEKKALDEKQVAKLAMIPSKPVRECLYRMFKGGYVFTQDVPKTADHSASRTFFLWTAHFNKTKELILSRLQKTVLNLKLRSQTEKEARKLLLEKTKRLDVISGSASLSEADKLGLEQLNGILGKLKTVELQLERMAMILQW